MPLPFFYFRSIMDFKNDFLADITIKAKAEAEARAREEKFKIFQSPLAGLKLDNHNRLHATDVRKLRRIVRDNTFRGTSAEETLSMWSNVDKEAEKNIYPYQDECAYCP